MTTSKPDSTSPHILFISDLHLDPARNDTIELSLQFFSESEGAQALFIMGDLFEYWLGDDAADPRLNAVYHALKAVSLSGTAVAIVIFCLENRLHRALVQHCIVTTTLKSSLVVRDIPCYTATHCVPMMLTIKDFERWFATANGNRTF